MALNSGSHACMQVLLLTEPSSQTCDSLRPFTLLTMVELPLCPCQLAVQHALNALVRVTWRYGHEQLLQLQGNGPSLAPQERETAMHSQPHSSHFRPASSLSHLAEPATAFVA